MERSAKPAPPEMCPFLVPVTADRLWMYPVGAYCRRPGGGVRVPAPATLASVCATPAHRACGGYRAGRDEPPR
ncbi:MAG: hypothetical protein A2X52_12620 [Candidatus Rokubacteria bacterium GWC2_70_16]|nr:MAG: hypothetical protein A2X52_12620 [Candidatus Rokubacteria bacterium GWC2_70_16]OGL20010.1 MAG: hypothetical protein A3K12_13050 [Candidatus Rokubacteria bacterium RIFCSPLOWO2_12_FULL_71_19]